MQRITGDIDQQILPDRLENGLLGVELREFAVGLRLGHAEWRSALSQQPSNRLQFRFGLFALREQPADGERRKKTNRAVYVFPCADAFQEVELPWPGKF